VETILRSKWWDFK